MMHGIYSQEGDDERLRFKGALIRQDPECQNNYLAQFDARYLPEALGWHSISKNNFVNIEGEDIAKS